MKTTARVIISAALLMQAAVAWADETAEAAFKRGQAALKAGRVAEACEAFEASNKLQAKIETELGLADCYEKSGRPISASRLYRAVSEKDTNAARKKTSAAKATKLEAQAPKLRITTDPQPDGLVVKIDGVEVSITGPVPVDVGAHEVVATAPGFEGRSSVALDKDKVTIDVKIKLEKKAEPAPKPTPEPTPAPTPAVEPAPEPTPKVAPMPVEPSMPKEPSGGSNRRRNGVIIGAVGVASLVGAGVFFAVSASKFDERDELCPNDLCANNADLDRAVSLRADARTYRGLSIGMGIGGVVLVGIGTYLFLTPGEKASRVSFTIENGGAGLAYTGRF